MVNYKQKTSIYVILLFLYCILGPPGAPNVGKPPGTASRLSTAVCIDYSSFARFNFFSEFNLESTNDY
jgi:hypothetical protein